MTLLEFQIFLNNSIPLTKQMGLKLKTFNQDELTLTSPLAPNINDKGSVFGGSSSALQIIGAWSLIKLNCLKNEILADIVIYKNETVWNKALYEKIKIVSKFQNNLDFEKIKNELTKKNNVKINTISTLFDTTNNICSTMKATYVILAK